MVRIDIDSYDMPPSSGWAFHSHDHEALLSYAYEGSFTQVTPERTWLVLPAHAVWMPAGTPHAAVIGPLGCRIRTVKLPTPTPDDLPGDCCVLEVSSLLASLIPAWSEEQQAERRQALSFLIYDEMRLAPRLDLGLPRLRDPRLQRITDTLLSDPADPRDLTAFAKLAAMSRRSFIRHFRIESGMSFAEWRRRLRLLTARQLLADGAAVTDVAFSIGYNSPSAFIAMMRRELGATPGQLYRRGADRDQD